MTPVDKFLIGAEAISEPSSALFDTASALCVSLVYLIFFSIFRCKLIEYPWDYTLLDVKIFLDLDNSADYVCCTVEITLVRFLCF